jgi:hypothetical protein
MVNNLRKRLINSRFFTISLFLHLILVIVLSGTVLFNKYSEPPDFTGGEGGGGFVQGDTSPQAPTAAPPMETQMTPTVTNPNTSAIQAITSTAVSPTNFVLPSIMTPVVNPTADISDQISQIQTPTDSMGGLTKEIGQGIASFTGGWGKGSGTGGPGGPGGPGSSIRQRDFEFTAYLAKYQGGDWYSTVRLSADRKTIAHGSLPNLLYIIGRISKDRIKAAPQALPLDLASEEIFSTKPPFILFTGHRDFKLTDKEVENLRKYIRLGGCIWGDSSLPGLRSRFDLAFRREMKRIISDVNVEWQKVPLSDPLFTNKKNLYWPEINTPPAGMNYYAEQVYALKQYGEIAVLYTPNDYCDMWQFGLTDQWKFDARKDEGGNYVAMNRSLWERRGIFYRNIEEEAVKRCYQFGMNIITHLITRWEDRLRTVPKGL